MKISIRIIERNLCRCLKKKTKNATKHKKGYIIKENATLRTIGGSHRTERVSIYYLY